jgi:hypothetical protein
MEYRTNNLLNHLYEVRTYNRTYEREQTTTIRANTREQAALNVIRQDNKMGIDSIVKQVIFIEFC